MSDKNSDQHWATKAARAVLFDGMSLTVESNAALDASVARAAAIIQLHFAGRSDEPTSRPSPICSGDAMGISTASGTSPASVDARITEYLSNGGLFNPELMDPRTVSTLLEDARADLREARAEVEQATKILRDIAEVRGSHQSHQERAEQFLMMVKADAHL